MDVFKDASNPEMSNKIGTDSQGLLTDIKTEQIDIFEESKLEFENLHQFDLCKIKTESCEEVSPTKTNVVLNVDSKEDMQERIFDIEIKTENIKREFDFPVCTNDFGENPQTLGTIKMYSREKYKLQKQNSYHLNKMTDFQEHFTVSSINNNRRKDHKPDNDLTCKKRRENEKAAQRMRLYRQRLREKNTGDQSNNASPAIRQKPLTGAERSKLWYYRKKLKEMNSLHPNQHSSESQESESIIRNNNLGAESSVPNLHGVASLHQTQNLDSAINLTRPRRKPLTGAERSKLWYQRKKLKEMNSLHLNQQSSESQDSESIIQNNDLGAESSVPNLHGVTRLHQTQNLDCAINLPRSLRKPLTGAERSKLWYHRKKLKEMNSLHPNQQASQSQDSLSIIRNNDLGAESSVPNLHGVTRLHQKQNLDSAINLSRSLLKPLTGAERSKLWYQRKKLKEMNSLHPNQQSSESQESETIIRNNDLGAESSVPNLHGVTRLHQTQSLDSAINLQRSLLKPLTGAERSKL